MSYGTEPRNPTAMELTRSASFTPAVLSSLGTSRLGSYLVDKSIPWSAVDLPLVNVLPQKPKDRAEVNLLLSTGAYVRMLYVPATDSWVQVGLAPLVTSLPTGTIPEGTRVIYDTGTAGVRWDLVYDSTDGTTYPWLYVGGSPLQQVLTGTTTRAVSTYGDVAAGAMTTWTLALAGDYTIDIGATLTPGSVGFGVFASFSVAGNTALDTDGAEMYSGAADDIGTASVFNRAYKTSLAAGTTIQPKFKAQGAVDAGVTKRFISITPVRVGA